MLVLISSALCVGSSEKKNENARNGVTTLTLQDVTPAGLYQVQAVGFGCVLIKRDVLSKMLYPMFEYFFPEDPRNIVSEDIVFCQNVYNLGKTVWVDSTVMCGHIGSHKFLPSLY